MREWVECATGLEVWGLGGQGTCGSPAWLAGVPSGEWHGGHEETPGQSVSALLPLKRNCEALPFPVICSAVPGSCGQTQALGEQGAVLQLDGHAWISRNTWVRFSLLGKETCYQTATDPTALGVVF